LHTEVNAILPIGLDESWELAAGSLEGRSRLRRRISFDGVFLCIVHHALDGAKSVAETEPKPVVPLSSLHENGRSGGAGEFAAAAEC